MSNRLLLLTALLAAPACTVPYPYSPYGPQANNDANGYGNDAATAVTEDGTVVVVVIDPAALDALAADARRTGRNVVQVNIGQGGLRQGNDLALSAEHNDDVLAGLAAAETGSAARPEPTPSRENPGWTRSTGNVSTVSSATPDKTERRVVETPSVSEPARPVTPAVTVAEPVREKPVTGSSQSGTTVSEPNVGEPTASAPTTPVTPRGPVITPGATRRAEEPAPSDKPQRQFRRVAGSSWWAPIGLIQKAKGDQ